MNRDTTSVTEVEVQEMTDEEVIEILNRPCRKIETVTNGGNLHVPPEIMARFRRKNIIAAKLAEHRERWLRFVRRWNKVRDLWEQKSYPTRTIAYMCRLAGDYSLWEAVSAGIDVDAEPAIDRRARITKPLTLQVDNLTWFRSLDDVARLSLIKEYRAFMAIGKTARTGYWASNPQKINSSRGI